MGIWSFIYRFVPDVWFQGISLRSYTGIMLISAIRARRRDRKLRKALNRLKTKYTSDKIATIYKKYSSVEKGSPRKEERRRRKFQRKLDKFVANFMQDYLVARMYYLDALKLISQSLLSSKRESKQQFTEVEVLFADIEKNLTQLIFPRREIQIFKGQLHQLLYDLMADIRLDERSDVMVARGSYPASISSFFSFLSRKTRWKRVKLWRKERKQVKLLGMDEKFLQDLNARLNQELQSGVRQDFLFMLIEFFKRVDVADKRNEEIKQDLMTILKKLWDDVEDVKKALGNILNLLRNEPQIKDNPQFAKVQEDIAALERTYQEILKQDFKNTEALRIMLQTVLQEGDVTMQQLERQAA